MESDILVKSIKVFKEHKGALYAISQGIENHLILVAGSDRNVIEFDLKSLQAKRLVAKSAAAVMSMHYDLERNVLLIGQAEGGVHVVDLTLNKELHYLKVHSAYVFDIVFIEDKEEFIFCSGDGSISVWSALDYSFLYQKKICDSKIRKCEYLRNRKELAISCGDGKVRVLSIDDYQEKYKLDSKKSAINVVAYDSVNETLLVGEKDAHLSLFELKTKNELLDLAAHYWALYDIKFNPEGTLFATASRDKTIKIWDKANMKVLKRIEGSKDHGHTHSVNALLWTSFSDYLLSAGDDGTLRIWQIQN